MKEYITLIGKEEESIDDMLKGIEDNELGNNHGATYYYNEYGLIIEYWNDAH